LLLAGIGLQAIWEARRRWYGKAGLAVTVVAFAYVVFASWSLNAKFPGDPRQFLVSAQSSPEVGRIADRLVAQAGAAERAGRPYRITVDAAEGATYPWAWYLRDLDVGYVDLGTTGTPPPSDAVILTQGAHNRLQTGRVFPFRIWWVPDYDRMSPQTWWRWFTQREPWNPTGGMPEWLSERR
jgi:hypothetical protein